MINIAWVRGAYLNNFEGQNYVLGKDIRIVGFSSLHPLHGNVPFPLVKLPCLSDFMGGKGRLLKAVANRTFGDMQVLFGLGNYAQEFDIFHTADPHYFYSYQLAKLRQRGKIRHLLVTSWETIPFNNESVSRKRIIKRFVLKHADHFLCYTEKAKKCLIEEGVTTKKIDVIRLGVDLGKFKPANKAPKKTITVLFVGRLVEEKGIMDLYEAFKLAADKNLRLKVVGDGPLKQKLKALVASDKMEKQVTLEHKKYEDIPAIYREADIFVLPSKRTPTWEEQYGMVFVEAMASGLPIITYDTGAIAEVVGGAGILLKENDIKGLAHAIQKLSDKKERDKIGTIGKERAARMFDSAKVALEIESLYKKLLK